MQRSLWLDDEEDDEFITDDDRDAVERLDPKIYRIDDMLDDTLDDLEQVADFVSLVGDVRPERDSKLTALIKLLQSDKELVGRKVIIATDVLAEGLNLQDANRLINFDLHWNPVRLMQRIGRVDRRMNPDIEKRLLAAHPDLKGTRETVVYWNFLPPEELEILLRLYNRVNRKTLVISKTFGIEGRKLLHPEDDFDPVKEINEQFEGQQTASEKLALEYEKLAKDHPDLIEKLPNFPLKTFSGKASPSPGTQAVFFCFRIPRPDPETLDPTSGQPFWTESAGDTVWMLLDLDGKSIAPEAARIANFVRSEPDTKRECKFDHAALIALREKAEKQLVKSDLENALVSQLQAFLLGLGSGFAFLARKQRLTLDGDHFYIDLVFYHTILKCHVLIDLKIGKLTHQDLGQLQLYVNYYNREIAFAHFHKDPDTTELPILRVLGWDGSDTPLKTKHVAEVLKNRKTGRDFIQTHGIPTAPGLTRSNYFGGLSSPRRLQMFIGLHPGQRHLQTRPPQRLDALHRPRPPHRPRPGQRRDLHRSNRPNDPITRRTQPMSPPALEPRKSLRPTGTKTRRAQSLDPVKLYQALYRPTPLESRSETFNRVRLPADCGCDSFPRSHYAPKDAAGVASVWRIFLRRKRGLAKNTPMTAAKVGSKDCPAADRSRESLP